MKSTPLWYIQLHSWRTDLPSSSAQLDVELEGEEVEVEGDVGCATQGEDLRAGEVEKPLQHRQREAHLVDRFAEPAGEGPERDLTAIRRDCAQVPGDPLVAESLLDSPLGGGLIIVVVSDGSMSIGAFSRASFLSVKALRAYHEAGLLVPARVDPSTGYRTYHATQLTDAAVIHR